MKKSNGCEGVTIKYFLFHKILKFMRNTLILLFLSTLHLFAGNSYSQSAKLSLNLHNASVENVLDEIERQSEFYFVFNYKLVDVKRQVDIQMESQPISEILTSIFSDSDVDYLILDRQILLSPKKYLTEVKAKLQPITVSGTITSESGETLPGASIVLKGTTRGAVTNLEGEYTIEVEDAASVLMFSYVGYSTQEVEVGNQTSIDIVLVEDLMRLDEVVVIGYGTMTKRDLTGSVASVTSDELVAVPVLSLEQAMQGRAAGVYVQNTGSNPGGRTQVRIRGVNSIQGNNDPLYIIDGLVGGDIQAVDPMDIESIDILKDASSTAIYGARGANGVVMVTTKTGKAGTNNIGFSMYYGWQKLPKQLDLMNAKEHAEFINALNTAEGDPITFPDPNNLPYDTDWQDELFRTAPMQSYNLSASGGSDKLNYYVSGNYISQDGIMEYTGYNRYNMRVNLDSKVSDRLEVGTRIGFSRVKRTLQYGEDWGGGSNNHHPLISATEISPTLSPYDADGNLVAELKNTSGDFKTNPMHHLANVTGESYRTLLNSVLYADIKILKDLSFKTNFGVNYNNTAGNRYKPSFVYEPNDGYRSRADVEHDIYTSWLSENYLTYKKTSGIHNLELLGGFTAQESNSEGMDSRAWDFAVDDFLYHNLAAGDASTTSMGSSMSRTARASLIGRIHYVLNGKYLLTATGRYDGSSKFGENNKWAFFPSAAFAWRLSDESFIENLNLFSNLKLRASYGVSGSDALGPYYSFSAMSPVEAYIVNNGIVNGFRPTRLANPDLRWEKTTQLDVGLDMGFFRGRLYVVMDYFNKTTDDLFLDKPVPQTAGVSSIRENIGSLNNSGLEFGIDAVPVRGNFTWNIGFNITYHQSEVTKLAGEDEELIVGNMGGSYKIGNMQIIKVGEALGSFYGYEIDGIWKSGDPGLATALQFGDPVSAGDWKISDLDGDGDVNDSDRKIIGNGQPKFYGGFNNTFTFKGFDAAVFFHYALGVNTLNAMQRNYLRTGSTKSKHRDLIGNMWTPTNEDSEYARIDYNQPGIITDQMVEDGSFMRLREVTIGYTLPVSVSSRIKVDRLRIYATGSNLALFTNYSGYDPEVNIYGGDNVFYLNTDIGSYPKARTIVLGLNMTF